ncbi:hypothetical protein AMJ44_02565 [candidate division WOR-1 bacterium DG_54_3]|uniref:NADH:quinone oxidoreductase/Mrp antiporter transmembrane domain-containing protein n=1 Tax=candidate division WOR-1 bacterium DG_54_3 TaxID=1703775 RepID=A0A0S7Y6H7_UNCSA|nr:MAG: hypothetical protein AMJ44_02565 [candidate division WOR-1 bacterium DG_54_3]
MNILLYSIFIPIIVSLFCFIFKKLAKWIAFLISFVVLILAGIIFFGGDMASVLLNLRAYVLSSGIFLAASFFTILIVLYSMKYMEGKERLGEYYGYLLITLGSTGGALFANDYIMFLLFWGILGLTLYMLIGMGGPEASSAAKKTFIIVGGTDALMILGIGIIWMITGSPQIGAMKLPLNNIFVVISFLSLAAAAFAKAGAIPLHSWIPDSAEPAPTTVMAYLPAALDKLLGIYLLTRICVDIFRVIPNSPISIFLLIIGSVTIIAAVMGALVQHNLKKLLSFHAVSQVGYMVLGIGTGIPVGIAGGLFHMLNHSIYKCCLFLTGGSVEHETGTTELDRLGGLARFMPLTFASALVAALSISGVPPFNGFVSKWMVYQGVIELAKSSPYWIIWLIAAMFGSALTLASFMKIIHATFLGQWSEVTSRAKEVPWSMWVPMVILASLCVIFGVFAYALPLAHFILPSIRGVIYTGFWSPTLATLLILVGLAIGLFIYWIGKVKIGTPKAAYVGGELLNEEIVKVSGVDFYNTIRNWGPLRGIYRVSERKIFDIYEIGSKITFGFSGVLKWLHNGLLHTYLAWMFLGVIILLCVLMR